MDTLQLIKTTHGLFNTSSTWKPPSYQIITTIRSDVFLLQSQENIDINLPVDSEVAKLPSQFYMLSHHQQRLLASARALGWKPSSMLLYEGPYGYDNLESQLIKHLLREFKSKHSPCPLMLRVALDYDGDISIKTGESHPGPASIGGISEPATTWGIPNPRPIWPNSDLYPKSLSDIAFRSAGAPSLIRWRVFICFNEVMPTLFTQHKTSERHEYELALAELPKHPVDFRYNGIDLRPEVLIINPRGDIMEGCISTPYFWREGKWITPSDDCGGNLGTTRMWALKKGLCETGYITGASVKYDEIVVLSNGGRGFQAGIVKPWTSLLGEDK